MPIEVLLGRSCRVGVLHGGRHLVILHRGAHKVCLAQHLQGQNDQHPAVCMHSVIKLRLMHPRQRLPQMP